MDVHALLAFTGVVALLTITPGLDMALVSRSAVADGRPAALATTWGIVTGLLVWALASALGVAAVVAASAEVYDLLRIAGAAYLVWLGVQSLRRAGHDPAAPTTPSGGRRAFRTGLVTNLANPKIAVFYSTVLPTFIAADANVLAWSLLLAAIHATLSLGWLSAYAWLLTRARAALHRPRVRRALERGTGAVLVGLGVSLALSQA
jgi:threonine/homoserine/homoserine lactone efflux protein